LPLTPREVEIVVLLIQSPGRVYSREEIAQVVSERTLDPESNAVSVYMSGLRRKLRQCASPDLIQTVRGYGYSFSEELVAS
jgi:DNA-binding response OmpR family regulator